MDKFLQEIIKEAGGIAMGYFTKGVGHTTKSNLGDLLTEADIAVSDFLVKQIQNKYPDHHIHCEEIAEDINPGAEFEWVIDPIDGTRNFAMGVPFWCVTIAVMKGGQPFLGAVYNPLVDQLFFAEKGKGALLNDKPIRVNNKDSIDYAFACFHRANESGTYGDYIERYNVAAMRLIKDTNAWIHSYGSGALAMCYLANGGIDFAAGNAGLDWDYIAPFLIAEEAGGIVTDSDGNPWQRNRQDYVMANPNLHAKVLELFQPAEIEHG